MSVEDPHEAERELRDEPAGEWDPEPVELRDGETRDASAHASANREMIRRARIEASDQDVREAIESAEDGGRDE